MNRQQYQQQQEEEWSDTKIIDILDKKNVPIKVTVNNAKREIVFMEIDIDYIKKEGKIK